MKTKEIFKNLCYHDKRNPDYYFDKDFDDEPPKPRQNCYCGNCFYGRDKLALELLSLQAHIGRLKSK